MALMELVGSLSSAKEEEEEEEGSYTHMMNRELYPLKKTVADDGCPNDLKPFPLLSGESIEYLGTSAGNILVVTNYRFFATQKCGIYSVPLGLIETTEVQHARQNLLLLCKDGCSFRYAFESPQKCRTWQDRLAEAIHRTAELKNTFAFVHRAYYLDQKIERREGGGGEEEQRDVERVVMNGHMDKFNATECPLLSLKVRNPTLWVVMPEFNRLSMDIDRVWRISECNAEYKICPSYPKLLVVPSSVRDEELVEAAKFRVQGRMPVIAWRHPTNGCVIARSSQPMVGVLGWRNPFDEKLLLAISQACSHTHLSHPPHHPSSYRRGEGGLNPLLNSGCVGDGDRMKERGTEVVNGDASKHLLDDTSVSGIVNEGVDEGVPLVVFDLRSYASSLGNRAKGGGCECQEYYPNCEVVYKGIPNIHAVRKSLQHLRTIVASEEQSSYLSNLESSQWPLLLSQLLSVACEVVSVVHDDLQAVLVHCSDGWDRTAQITSLAELLMDPFYRTIEGFEVLVEREWFEFGHKFGERCGHACADVNQRSPIFLQWLDCVHQLIRQFPCDFEFSEAFLVKLGRHCYSCLFGSFLCNCSKEREEARIMTETFSVWSFLHSHNPSFLNYLYCPNDHLVLRPATHVRHMLLWKAMYCSPLFLPYHDSNNSKQPPSPTSCHQVTRAPSITANPWPNSVSNGSGSRLHHSAEPLPKATKLHDAGNKSIQNRDSLYCQDLANGSNDHQITSAMNDIDLVGQSRHSSLLQSALQDDCPKASSPGSEASLINSVTPYLGADGFPVSFDDVQDRVKELELLHVAKIAELQKKLDLAVQIRQAEEYKCTGGGSGKELEGEEEKEELVGTPDSKPPSSITSWDCVDSGDSHGVRWVPDHAVTDCQGCGKMFWAAVRKHHCRSCGGVFCGTCTQFFCPVPCEGLHQNVRVCEKCYYKLDGHLNKDTSNSYSYPA